MKRATALILLSMALCWADKFAAEQSGFRVFVSPAGDDKNSGSEQSPLRSLGAAASRLMPGDVCMIRGGVYRETVRPSRSGKLGAPIRFQAYPGEAVHVVGTEQLNVRPEGGGVFGTTCNENVRQLFCDGQMLVMARWPNVNSGPFSTAWAKAEVGSNWGRITSLEAPRAAGRTSGWITLQPGSGWVTWTRPLLFPNQGTLNLSTPEGRANYFGLFFDPKPFQRKDYEVKVGTPFFIAGSPDLLDAPGEWCQVGDRVLLRPWSTKPGPPRVEAKIREHGFNLSRLQYVEIQDIRFFACNADLTDATGCCLEACHFDFVTHFESSVGFLSAGHNPTGVTVSGETNLIKRCSISHSAGNGITLNGKNNRVEDCLVRNANYSGVDCACIYALGTGNTVERCTLTRSGRSVLNHRGLKGGRLAYNELSSAGLLTTDCGITYTWNDDGQGTEICFNWLHDNQSRYGCGLYLDNGCSNFRIHHNVAWNVADSGYRLNTPCRNVLMAFCTSLQARIGLDFYNEHQDNAHNGSHIVNNLLLNGLRAGRGALYQSNFAGAESNLTTAPTTVTPRELWDFRLAPDSLLLAKGTPLLDFHKQKQPDPGAYQRNEPLWRPGHNWGEPPPILPEDW